jgi:hypothetical protein
MAAPADGWTTKERGADGKLQADPQKFPAGLKALSTQLGAMGEWLPFYGPLLLSAMHVCMQPGPSHFLRKSRCHTTSEGIV